MVPTRPLSQEGHRSPKVLGKYYSDSTGVFAHGYLRAFASETHAQVSETARTGAAAGHSGESGRECCHAPLRGALPLRGPHPPFIMGLHYYCMSSSHVLLHLFLYFFARSSYILQHLKMFSLLYSMCCLVKQLKFKRLLLEYNHVEYTRMSFH